MNNKWKKAMLYIWKMALGGTMILSLVGCSAKVNGQSTDSEVVISADAETENDQKDDTAGQGESGQMPQLPGGQGPDGQGPNGQPPQMPDGEMPDFENGQPPQMPDGGQPNGDFPDGEAPGIPDQEVTTENVEPSESTGQAELSTDISEYYTDRDMAGTWDEKEATTITLFGANITVAGQNAAKVETNDAGLVTITGEGVYILTGSYEGQIVVAADKSEKVQLVLNGVAITNENSAGIWVKTADKVFLTLAEGTANTVTTGDSFTFEVGEDEPDAAVFSKEDLTINGSGTLEVTTGYQDGIVSKDDLKICGGTIIVEAEDDAIRGKDSVRILAGDIRVTTNTGHGIKSTNEEEADRGYIRIDGGSIDIDSGNDGLHAVNDIQINAGTITIDAADDGIHTDANLVINRGTIDVVRSYEGLEGYTITINDGSVTLVASDDGLNAAGGNDASSMQGGFGMDPFSSGSNAAGIYIQINGGTTTLTAGGDGIDSNGSLYINGGTTYVNGPTSGGNGSLDIGEWGAEAVITGGTILTAGTSDMPVLFDSSSAQLSFLVYLDRSYSAGSDLVLKDASGSTVLSYSPLVTYSCVIFSDESLQVGSTYTLSIDGQNIGSYTLSSTAAAFDSNGNETYLGGFGGMGGFGGPGGQGGQGGFGGPGGQGGQGGQGSQGGQGGQGGFGSQGGPGGRR